MPHQHDTYPKYREHKATGQAVVTLSGKDHYLGKHGTPESRSKFERLIREYVNHGFSMPAASDRAAIVAHVCERYEEFAARHYRHPDGSPTGTVENTSLAMEALCDFAGDVPVEQFGPRLLDQFRTKLIERDLARHTINDRIGIVKRAFKWASRQELIPASVHHALATVEGLRRGRDGARETDPVEPVSQAHIDASLPFMPEPVQAMVRLQLLTGARPGEIVTMRACDIDRSRATWIYRPAAHKNSWRGKKREIYLGGKAREIVKLWMRPGLQEQFMFSPCEAERIRKEKLRSQRKTPLYPSHVRAQERKRKAEPKVKPGDHYDVDQYRQAITRACAKGNVAHWHPNQLRHNAATLLSDEFGLEVARVVLGHHRVETTQIYVAVNREKGMAAIEKVG